WTGLLSGGVSTYKPIILNRYADPDTSTAFVETIYIGDYVTLLCRIDDPNLTPSTITVTADTTRTSMFDGPLELYDDGTNGDRIANDNVFSRTIPNPANISWEGAIITFAASNEYGTTVSRYTLNVRVISQTFYENRTTYVEGNGTEGYYGEGGLPGYLGYINFRQGYDIFKGNESTIDISHSARVFNASVEPAEWVYVRVASWDLYSANVENTFILANQRGQNAPATNYDAFTILQTNPYIFQYKFNIYGYPSGAYSLTIRMRDDQNNVFYTFDNIFIGDEVDVFEMTTYQDSDYTQEINYFASTDVIYVDIPTTSSLPLTIRGVVITDFYGDTQVRGAPTTLPLMDYVPDTQGRRFWVDLRYANQDPWKLGNQSYSIRVSFTDNDGLEYTLTQLLKVRAPRNRLDFVLGTGGIGSGQQNFAHFDYMYWTRNNNFFTTRILEEMDSTPGARSPLLITTIAFGDLDADGDYDILAGVRYQTAANSYTHYLGYYENRIKDIGRFEERSNLHRPAADMSEIRAIAIGDVTGDNVNDFAVGTNNGNVWFYHNTYGIPYTKVTPDPLGAINTIAIVDVLGGQENRG
ncbi:MAG: hypothetical protein QCI38_08005, partial [Candidatus Thermoplasmatota archaeon]|nr:hypothetical protein [Candidatus Thermoplasmatota archaeon]